MARKNVPQRKANKDAKLVAIYKGVLACQPALLPSLVEEVADAVLDNQQIGMPWRITAVLAGKDGEFFTQVAEDEEMAKTMAALIDSLTFFSKRLEKMKALADTVRCRLLVAGCNHEDFNDWVEEAA
jgi:hypothetical protein